MIARVARRLFPPSETLEGYEHPELVDIVFRKTSAYRPIGQGLQVDDAKTVLDFGGGCGLHFKQANSPTVRWAIVETPAMVNRARELSTDRLQFFTNIQAAADWLGHVNLVHSDGAIQYTSDPEQKLTELCGLKAKHMLWSRVLLGEEQIEVQAPLLADNGPGWIEISKKTVRYARRTISARFS